MENLLAILMRSLLTDKCHKRIGRLPDDPFPWIVKQYTQFSYLNVQHIGFTQTPYIFELNFGTELSLLVLSFLDRKLSSNNL